MSGISEIQRSTNYSSSSAASAAQAQQSATKAVEATNSGSGTTDMSRSLKVEETQRTTGTKGKESGEATTEALKKAVEEINKNSTSSEAQFAVHEATNRIMIKIVDRNTKEVIKEFPPEKTLDMIAKAWELAGLTIDERR